MKKSAILVLIALALGTIIGSGRGAPGTPSATAEGPIGIRACRTIDRPGSYILEKNLTATDNCLVINANFVTIDLNGFSIGGSQQNFATGTGILGGTGLFGIAVRNGSISDFSTGVDLSQDSGSIVEGLRLDGTVTAITANGIVMGNLASSLGIAMIANGAVIDNYAEGGALQGMEATGTVRGNTASSSHSGMSASGTVIGNNISGREALFVSCPSNVIENNTAGVIGAGLVLDGTGCNSVNNLAPSADPNKRRRLSHPPMSAATAMIGPGKSTATPIRIAEGPIGIRACRTIDRPGSYILEKNLTATDNCLTINASYVTIDLNGFLISGAAGVGTGILGVAQSSGLTGIAIRNGSISGFAIGVDLSQGYASIVEGLRISSGSAINANGLVRGNIAGNGAGTGIVAYGTVTDNVVEGFAIDGIDAGGIVRGNTVSGNQQIGLSVFAGSLASGNTVTGNTNTGILATCPVNLVNNTATGNASNLVLNGTDCANNNNVAP